MLDSVYDLVFLLQNLQQELQKNPDSLPFDEVCIFGSYQLHLYSSQLSMINWS
jgi:hypothetical protein